MLEHPCAKKSFFVLISQQKEWTKKNHFNFSILNTFCNEILAIPIVFALDAFCQCQTHLDPQVILIAKYNVFYSTRSNTRINTFGFVLLKILIHLISSGFLCNFRKKQTPIFISNISTAILRLFNHGFRGEQLLICLVQTIQTVEVENLRSDRVTQLFRGNTLM